MWFIHIRGWCHCQGEIANLKEKLFLKNLWFVDDSWKNSLGSAFRNKTFYSQGVTLFFTRSITVISGGAKRRTGGPQVAAPVLT